MLLALDYTANGAIKRSRLFERVFVQPAEGDDGTSLGAALWAQRLHDPNFNVRGQPIVCTPREALDTFLWARLDVLVIGDYPVLPSGTDLRKEPAASVWL